MTTRSKRSTSARESLSRNAASRCAEQEQVERRIAAAAAGAEVHRRDELEASREERHALRARDADDAVLERLAERLERGPQELRQLVEQQHAAVREARLARASARVRRRRSRRRTRCGAAPETAGT